MVFSISLYVALAVFGIGLIYKTSTWFRYTIGIETEKIPTSARAFSAFKGIAAILFSVKLLTLIKVFVVDVILQIRILRQDFLRWLMHIFIYVGFMLLLLMHALENFVSAALFTDYYSTINPFMFLRDLFGAFVILGIGIALYRRFVLKVPRLKTNAMDIYAVIILGVIMVSGILLEGAKISSHTEFQGMVEDYAGLTPEDDADELKALESLWVKEFGVVSPTIKGPFDPELLEEGRESHEAYCAECHSSPKWAFTGYAFARVSKPIALALDKAGSPTVLWYIHFLACFIGLAYLPFSKMFHIFAGPLSLLANSVMEKGESDPANIATRQVMELDACTHCCTCSLNCSAGVFFHNFANTNIFPSEKILSIKALASGKQLNEDELRHIQEGVYLCTNCYRCTVVCPVGINLQDLWFSVRELLLRKGHPEFLALSPLSFYRGLMKEETARDNYQKPLDQARQEIADRCELMKMKDKTLPLSGIEPKFKEGLRESDQASTFSGCFGCETCTTVCPVVANYDNPMQVLGLLPHQIMHSCGLGLKDLALGSNMLWDCLTCYKCQEQCPQQVNVADIIYELKNIAVEQVKERPQTY
ncbi:MAG: 4Fe-4S dicluster domain-containing protein [Thermodesulfobacteriota bacterium]|nr:4Fe-4S dicluster domain-containing protein [Thermodesulfobacteriota bacterium]